MMADEQADKGNPNVFKTFKGIYKVPLTSGMKTVDGKDYMNVALTCTNDVVLMDDIKVTYGTIVAYMPEKLIPNKNINVPVLYYNTANYKRVPATLVYWATGELEYVKTAFDGTFYDINTLFLNGITFNISGNFYRNIEVGE